MKTNCVDGVISEYGPIFNITLPFSGIGTIPAESRTHTESIKEIVIGDLDATLLYPNPASKGINLVYKTISEETIFKIYDRMGRTIFSQTLSPANDLYLFDIASFPAGIYLGAVFEKGELRYAEQFYKQRR